MEIRELYYLAVPGKDNTNYFRIRVRGHTRLGEAEYRSGWFPATSVDRLYGSTLQADMGEEVKTRQEIQGMLNSAIVSATHAYLEVAKDPQSRPDEVQSRLVALRRVRATAGDEIALPSGAIEIEYDPAASLKLRNAGEKLVLTLSSDPNAVINAIKQFSEQDKTRSSVLRLAEVIQQRAVNDVVEAEAKRDANQNLDELLVQEMDSALVELGDSSMSAEQLRTIADSLLLLVENLE